MAQDPKKRQKKLEKRAAKRHEKTRSLAREKHAGLPERLEAAQKYPVLHSWISDTVWEDGIGSVCLSRQLPGGQVAYAVWLVDRYCLGVKDAMVGIAGSYTYDMRVNLKMRRRYPCKEVSPAAVRKLVEAAVDYARDLGFAPHPDHARARLLFGAIDPAECQEAFELGKDGKPYYISGPYDTPERVRHIIATLDERCGTGNYHYMGAIGPGAHMVLADQPDAEEDQAPAELEDRSDEG